MISFITIRLVILLSLVSFAAPIAARASDFYIISSTHKTQAEAQAKAAEGGGWVLITNFYKRLNPDLFAVVRGPFRSQKEAEKVLSGFRSNRFLSDAYVRDAGDIRINAKVGNVDVTPQILAAILGEIRIASKSVLKSDPNSYDPGEPQEPYKNFTLSYFSVTRPTFKPYEVPLERIPFEFTRNLHAG
jgi:hypothetical protein